MRNTTHDEPTVTDANPDAIDAGQLIDRLESITHDTGHRLPKVFGDWIDLCVAAFIADDDTYHATLEEYDVREGSHERSAQTFAAALGDLVSLTTTEGRPIVGDLYERVGARSEPLGQHFTPWSVCQMLAELSISDDDIRSATPVDPLTVSDPACGSGRLLIAKAMAVHNRGPSAVIAVRGTDKDRTCAKMAVINLVLAEVPGVIRYGDSLTQEISREWIITPDARGPIVTERTSADSPRADSASGSTANETADELPRQRTLPVSVEGGEPDAE